MCIFNKFVSTLLIHDLAGFHTEPWERGDFPPKNHGLESYFFKYL